MKLISTTLRPGLLVSLKTSVIGNISYEKRTTEAETTTDAGALRAAWETVRTIDDPKEHEAAGKARSKAASLVRAVCARSAFGLLCPEARSEALANAMEEARKVANAFNATAKLSRVSVYIITGRIAPDDVEAVKAINSEIAELLARMAEGVKTLDTEAIRDAASRAREMGTMLPPETASRVQAAVDAARIAARKIVKAGTAAAQEIDAATIRQITEARTAFLDLDGDDNVAAPTEEGRAIDLEPEPITTASATEAAPMMEFN